MTRKQHMRTFYTLILTQTFSLVGSQISGLAIGIWVYNQTGNATPLALVAFFAVLPMMLASSISGVLADRWDRRYVMALSDAGQAAGTLLLLFAFMSGDFQLWHLYTVTLIQSVFGVFQRPAFQASITMLIPDEHRDRANTLQQMTGPAAGIIAPAIAGLIYAGVGVTGAILIDLATFVVAVLVVLNVSIPHPEQSAEGRETQGTFVKEALGGLEYLWSRRTLLMLALHFTLVNFLLSGSLVLSTPYILARTGDEAMLGILASVLNLGAIVGGIIFGIWGGTRPRIHTMMLGIIAASILLIFLGLAQIPITLGITLFLLLIPMPMINASAMSILQIKVPPDLQGRVFAVITQVTMFLTPVAYLIVGPLADKVFEPAVGQPGWEIVAPLVGNSVGSGMGLIMVMAGALTTVASMIIYALPRIRQMEATLPDYVAKPVEDQLAVPGAPSEVPIA